MAVTRDADDPTGEQHVVVEGGYNARYLPSGHLTAGAGGPARRHTSDFWLRVERALPAYERRKEWIAQHGMEFASL